jgi:hypothetical protein
VANEPSQPTVSLWPAVGAAAALVAVVLTIVGGVGSIILGNLNARLEDSKAANADLNLRMAPLLTLYAQHQSDKEQAASMVVAIDGKVGLAEYRGFDRMISDRLTAAEASSAARNEEVVQQLHRLEDTLVTRAENQVHWGIVDALTIRVNDLAKSCAAK